MIVFRLLVTQSLVFLWLWKIKTLRANRVVEENRRPGTRDWWTQQETEANENRTRILGFATRLSARPGDLVNFKVDNKGKLTYVLRIYRLGYYGGDGGRLVDEIPALESPSLVNRDVESEPTQCQMLHPRTIDCSNWKVALTWKVPSDAVSGVYVAVPFAQDQINTSTSTTRRHFMIRGPYIPLVILLLENHSKALAQTQSYGSDILFKLSDLTWVAYNMFGGWNLYTSTNDSTRSFESRARVVSYNRPFSSRLKLQQGGKHQNFLFGAEYAALRWLEKHGYDVSYAACADVEDFRQRGLLSSTSNFRILLSVGHDEYWTGVLKEAFEHARDSGIHLIFWSGNELFWRVRWEDTPEARDAHGEKRIVIAKKETIDILCNSENCFNSTNREDHWTGTFGDVRAGFRAQNSLSGQLFAVNGHRHDAILVPSSYSHFRFWRNTTLASQLGTGTLNTGSVTTHYETPAGILGYEWDVFADDCGRPPGLLSLSSTTKVVQKQLLVRWGGAYNGSGEAIHRISLYRHTGHNGSSALVFGAGTVQWAWALSRWHDGTPTATDENLQQASVNILADMGVQPASLRNPMRLAEPSSDREPPASIIVHPPSGRVVDLRRHGLKVTGRARDMGDGHVAAVEVSLDGGLTWRFANGTERWAYHFPGAGTLSGIQVNGHGHGHGSGHGHGHGRVHGHNSHGRVHGSGQPLANSSVDFFSYWCIDPTTNRHAWPLPQGSVHDQRVLRYVVTVLSRAVDDSGWREELPARLMRPPRLLPPLTAASGNATEQQGQGLVQGVGTISVPGPEMKLGASNAVEIELLVPI